MNMELYSSFMKLAPLLILKLLATGRFGPTEPDTDRHGWVSFAGDVALMVAVVVGGFIAVLVLGDVLPSTTATRWVLVVTGCMSLLVLAAFKLGQVTSLYRARPTAASVVCVSGGYPEKPG